MAIIIIIIMANKMISNNRLNQIFTLIKNVLVLGLMSVDAENQIVQNLQKLK